MNSLPHVLLIANRPQTLSAIQGVLTCHLTVAWTVQSAIDASQGRAFDLVIVDSRLDRVNAQHLVDCLRQLPGQDSLPALVLTKSGVDEMVEMALASFLADKAAEEASQAFIPAAPSTACAGADTAQSA